MRIKQFHVLAPFVALYLLGINVLILQHSFEHTASGFESFSKNYTSQEENVHIEHSNILCDLCDFFQNQVLFFSCRQTVTFVPTYFDLQFGKVLEVIPFEVFVKRSRGPPILR